MAISSAGVGYQFLPPIIRADPNMMSGASADTSHASNTGTATVRVAAPATPAADTAANPVNTGKHLLRITV